MEAAQAINARDYKVINKNATNFGINRLIEFTSRIPIIGSDG